MSNIGKDAGIAAAWIAQALQSSGYKSDFSPESLWHIDFSLMITVAMERRSLMVFFRVSGERACLP